MLSYLGRKIFAPLGMHPIILDDSNGPTFPAGHHRNALGPVRVATPAARGWLWAAGELSMTAEDLAKWDVARLNRSLVPADDWAAQEAPVHLADGTSNGYGLGVSSGTADGRRYINHGGESVGFLSENTVYPDDRAAVVVLTNADFGDVTDPLTTGLTDILLHRAAPASTVETDRVADVRALYDAIASGTFDKAKLTDNANFYFDKTTLGDYRSTLGPLGAATSVTMLGTPRLRGGFVKRRYRIVAGGKTLSLNTYAEPGARGRWEQFIVSPE
jgi:CubicO group peptidase (beta-lactamase class C family)